MRISHGLPVLPPQPPTPSAEVLALRTNWKWAYLSHFLFTYNPMLHLEDIQLSELEDDLANGTFHVIPTVMQRLLTSLTPHDKRSILENWQHHLRKQSLRRAPDHNLMGTEDDPVDFSSLIMTDKLHILQSLCEWQFHNPNNLRTRMRDDDDYANWRIEPIAYDAKYNAYWLMGGNRLWIQHAPSRKRNGGSHKRKQPSTSVASNRKTTKRGAAAAAPSKPVAAPSKSKPAAVLSSSGRPTRSTRSRQTPTESLATQRPRITGTRVSTRLRRREEEEVWQSIPEEWLKEGSSEDIDAHQQLNGKQKENEAETKDTPLNPLDDVSELTSLSELSDMEEGKEEGSDDVGDADDEDEDKVQDSRLSESPDLSSANEDKWETVCVTLAEWEAFPQRFEKSTHRREKDFYKLLINDLVPMITEVLRVDVRKKHMEEAVVHRKRSSRIAVKESVREAERAEARRKAEEEKEMERHRRWEARARKEEEERLRKEALRSARLREKAMEENESLDVDIVDGEPEKKPQATNGNVLPNPLPPGTTAKFIVNGSKATTQAPKDDEPWELDCEICHKRGMNLDDGLELMSCERCNKWQHIRCHDQADFIAGRPPRDWEVVDFLCAACSTSGVTVAQQSQPHRYPQGQAFAHYNGAAANTSSSGSMRQFQKPPVQRTAQQFRSGPKPQTASNAMPYNNGRAAYATPKQQYLQPAAPLYVQRQPSAVPSGTATYPTSAAQSHASAAMPYASTPNLYLSNATGNYRSLQQAHKATAQPQTQPSLAHYQGHTTATPASTGTWTQQQAQYSNLAAWSSAGSAPPHSGQAAAQFYEHPQQNGYYRSHVAMQSSPLVQPQVGPTQRYHPGGPQS